MDLIFLGQIAGACIAIGSALALGIKYLILRPIKLYIDTATYPISPKANGGMALPDAIRAIHDVKELLHEHIEKHDTQSK
jgi:hypothetical protein